MFHEIYQNIPQNIDPIAISIGSFPVRWYGLMYLVGFLVVYGLLRLRLAKNELGDLDLEFFIPNLTLGRKKIENLIEDFLLASFLCALMGGRIGYVLFYNTSHFLANPLEIIYPYDKGGIFVGLYGMSYHGAIIGASVGGYLFLRKKKIDFLRWTDFVVPAIPLGYFFGRIGNFLNGELYGRVTYSSLGMYFVADRENLRFPTQLFEAILEGIVVFLILWVIRNRTEHRGMLSSFYIMGYAIIRFVVEFFREPDPQLGLFLNFFSMGQILSFFMFAFGIFLYAFSKKETVL